MKRDKERLSQEQDIIALPRLVSRQTNVPKWQPLLFSTINSTATHSPPHRSSLPCSKSLLTPQPSVSTLTANTWLQTFTRTPPSSFPAILPALPLSIYPATRLLQSLRNSKASQRNTSEEV